MKNKDIIFLSSDDWGWKTSKYHLSKRLANNNRVLFVSSIGFRAPTASREHLGRIFTKLRKFFSGIKQVPEGPYVLSPIVIPFSWFPFRKQANSLLFRMQIAHACRKLKFKSDFVFMFSQNWHPYLSIFDSKLVYYCVDDQSAFSSIDQQKFRELDQKSTEQADIVFCSSYKLYETKLAINKNTHYSPHGVEYEAFSQAAKPQAFEEPADISALARPRLVFFGHISNDWVDASTVKHLAGERPDWSILLLGRYSMSPSEFDDFPNVHVLGEKEFHELPAYCAYSDIGLIPFVDSELVRNCNPLKLPEYLSAGIPVVSSSIPEVSRHAGPVVKVAASNAEFLAHCDALIKDAPNHSRQALSESLANRSWEARVEAIYSKLDAL